MTIFLYILTYKCLFTLRAEMGCMGLVTVFSVSGFCIPGSPGSGGGLFPICPGFCGWLQFSGIFRAVTVGFSLYARNFTPAGNPQEISGQWRRGFSYIPGILWLAPILRNFLGSGGRFFPICPEFCGWLQFSGIFWAVATGIFLYARNFVAGSNSQEFSGQ